MPSEQSAGYLPGDPRYGLQGEALKDYYRTKPTQWAIYCWDKPGMEAARRTLAAEQSSYAKNFGERVIGYGHFISDDGRDTLGTSFFMELDDLIEQCLAPTFNRRLLDHACGCVTIGIWLALCAASLIMVPPCPSLAATKLEAM